MMWLVCAVGGAAARQQGSQDPRLALSIRSGVYSQSQARRGLIEYTRSCERCHGSDLTGNATDEVPALVADAFMFHWGGRTVQDLHDRIRKAMPADAPGTLEPAAYVDIVAYLLEANGYPSGSEDLDRSRLRTIVIDKASRQQRE
jgi:mono/diheme cytochrome c family protein